jgi:P pilus assembly chaperone PapD
MGLLATNFSIGTVAAIIAPADSNPQSIHIHNNSEHTIYVGSSNVTTTTGLNILKQQSEEFYLTPGDNLFAIADGASRDVRVLRLSK